MADGILDPEMSDANPTDYHVPEALHSMLRPHLHPSMLAQDVWALIKILVAFYKAPGLIRPAHRTMCAVAFCRAELLANEDPAQAWRELSVAQREAVTLWAEFL